MGCRHWFIYYLFLSLSPRLISSFLKSLTSSSSTILQHLTTITSRPQQLLTVEAKNMCFESLLCSRTGQAQAPVQKSAQHLQPDNKCPRALQKPHLLSIPAITKEQFQCTSFNARPTNNNHCASFHQTQQSKSSSKTSNTSFHQRLAIKVQIKPISHSLTCKLRSYLRISKVQFQFPRLLFTSQDTSLYYYLFWSHVHKYCELVHLFLSYSCLTSLLHIELIYLYNHNSN